MSATLDALRRARRPADEPRPAGLSRSPRRVPDGLGFGRSQPARPGRREPARWVAAAVVASVLGGLGALVVWVAVTADRAPDASTESVEAGPSTSAPSASPIEVAASVPPGTVGESPGPPGEDLEIQTAAIGSPLPGPVEGPTTVARSPATRAPELSPVSAPMPEAAPTPAPPKSPAEAGIDHFQLAVQYHNLGRFEPALEHYLSVLSRNELNVQARNNLGLLYYEHARPEDAIEQFRRAVAIQPDYVKARGNLAVVLTGAGRLVEARAELRAALEAAPRDVDLLVNLALVEKAAGTAEAAIELLIRAVGDEPTHAMAHYNLGVLYDQRGALALAAEHYRAFLRHGRPDRGTLLAQVERRLLEIDALRPAAAVR